MRRREFIIGLSGAAAWPVGTRAQQPDRMRRIGWLGVGNEHAYAKRVEALRVGLRNLGHVEGRNILIEFRWAERVDELPAPAEELVRMNVDVIFAVSSTEVAGARQASGNNSDRLCDPCRSGGCRTCCEPRAAGRKCNGTDDAALRTRGQGTGDIQGGCATRYSGRRSLESHYSVTLTGLEGG